MHHSLAMQVIGKVLNSNGPRVMELYSITQGWKAPAQKEEMQFNDPIKRKKKRENRE